MEVSGQLHDLATLPPLKGPLSPTGQEAGWAAEPIWTLWRRGNSLALTGIEPDFSVVQFTLLTALSRPPTCTSTIHAFFIYGFCYFTYVIVTGFHLFPIKVNCCQTHYITDIALHEVTNWSLFI
jgi:hypothetical protein